MSILKELLFLAVLKRKPKDSWSYKTEIEILCGDAWMLQHSTVTLRYFSLNFVLSQLVLCWQIKLFYKAALMMTKMVWFKVKFQSSSFDTKC